jgi:hypothetical protein
MDEIKYTERTLRFIGGEFTSQSKSCDGKYYIKSYHFISADYPFLELLNFQGCIRNSIVAGKIGQMRVLLKPILKLASHNIKLYKKSVKPLWESLHGFNPVGAHKKLKITKGSEDISIIVELDHSNRFGAYLNKENDPNDFKKYHNENLYDYSLEIHDFLHEYIYNESTLMKIGSIFSALFVEIVSRTISKTTRTVIAFIVLYSAILVYAKHHQAEAHRNDKITTALSLRK